MGRAGEGGREGVQAESKIPSHVFQQALSGELGASGCGRSELRLGLLREGDFCVSPGEEGL